MITRKRWLWPLLGLVVVVAAVAVMAVSSHAMRPLDGVVYWPSYRKGMTAVEMRLNDPESAKFRNLFFSRVNGVSYLCGELNARNRMGGYVGYSLFYASRDSGDVAIGEDSHTWPPGLVDHCGQDRKLMKSVLLARPF